MTAPAGTAARRLPARRPARGAPQAGPLSVDGARGALVLASAVAPAALTWLLVFGLTVHRPDLDVAPAHLPATFAAFLVGVSAAVGGWAVTGGWAATASRTGQRDAVDHGIARLALPLIVASYTLVAFGVLIRLRTSGLGTPLTGLMLALLVGTAGLVGLPWLLRRPPRSAHGTSRGPARAGGPGPGGPGRENAGDARARLAGAARWAVPAVAAVALLLAGFDRGDEAHWVLAGVPARPAALLPLALLAAAVLVARPLLPEPFFDDAGLPDGYLGGEDGGRTWPLVALAPLAALALLPLVGLSRPAPVVAVAVGAAVLVYRLARSRPLVAAGLVAAAVVHLIVVTAAADVWRASYDDDVAQHVALAAGRGGLVGAGAGLGLVEAYVPDGEVPGRYALAVVAEELGLVGLLAVLAACATVAVLLIRLASRCVWDDTDLWARPLAWAMAATLALPVLALFAPGLDVAPPGVAPDGVALVALLWTVGIVSAAARRSASSPYAARRAAATADPGTGAGRPAAGGGVARGWVASLCAVLLAVVAAGAMWAQVASLADARATHDGDDVSAIEAADERRLDEDPAALNWKTSGNRPVPGIDAATAEALEAAVGGEPRCPALSAADTPGPGALGRRCPAPAVMLDPAAQQAAVRAIDGLPAGTAATVVALDADDGRLLVLATGVGGPGEDAGAATPAPSATPTPSVTATGSASPDATASPTGSVPPTDTASPTGSLPPTGAGTLGAPGAPSDSPVVPAPTTAPVGEVDRDLTAPDGKQPARDDPPGTGTTTEPPATGTATEPPGTGLVTEPPATGTATEPPGTGTATEPPAAGPLWARQHPVGAIGRLLVNPLSAEVSPDVAARVLHELRAEAAVALEFPDVLLAELEKPADPAVPPDPAQAAVNAEKAKKLKELDDWIADKYPGCVIPARERQPLSFRDGAGCAPVLQALLRAGGVPAAVPSALAAFSLSGPAGVVLRDEGIGATPGMPGVELDAARCQDSVDTCARVSPLQLAVVLAGLHRGTPVTPGILDLENDLARMGPDAAAPSSSPLTDKIDGFARVTAAEGGWSLSLARHDGHDVIVVSYVVAAPGAAVQDQASGLVDAPVRRLED
ncbi:FtsW/RodA/SpoVE family cell cycle protein [Frankia sp. CNm7]|uniref:FtsW/RodA/SpoVE family cell cycle protein n=1 Tax=Frankia nepalensis TaxID=1836974 RepID=UPI0019326C6E|nr:FtsW/RodA/SpoVE family cell cycle protein [Frankia nepalensis]MBL7523382.1 FtsW/RodA/SpoVE family cell cycle protein [Frankia nepalensis]